MDYNAMMAIDPDALDVEWLEQPGRFMAVSKHASKLRQDFDRLEEKIGFERAKLVSNVRKHPGRYGFGADDRITEGGINAAVAQDELMRKLEAERIELKYKLDVVQSAVRAMDHRKGALENLVRLHAQQYFAGPKDPRDLNLEAAKRSQRNAVREKVRKVRRMK